MMRDHESGSSPMPTARWSTGVLSLQSALVVAGGFMGAVEIFKPDTSQWYRADPLPTACIRISLVALGNTLYICTRRIQGPIIPQSSTLCFS